MQAGERVLDLEGGHNFRDIGGYRTEDGRSTRWGLVYRSGSLANIGPAGEAALAALGVKLVCDFRSNIERQAWPTKWPSQASTEFWLHDHESSVADMVRAMSQPEANAADTHAFMVRTYKRLPYNYAPAYREMFARLAQGDLPMVFHCSAGKDRTGVAAALLLTALDAPRETVLQDYMITERFFEQGCAMVASDPHALFVGGVAPEIWAPLMRADPAYLAAMFEELEQRHSHVHAFLEAELDVDAAARERLKLLLLD